MLNIVNSEFLTLNIRESVPCIICFGESQAHRLIEGGGFLFYRVMFEVYSFRENHSPEKKRGLYSIPENQWRATSRHDDFLTSHLLKPGSKRG
jgi:hypothetical protein